MEENFQSHSERIIMYGSLACAMVPPVRGLLNRAQVPFDYINIFEDPAASARVKEINNGYASVPTLVFPDGSTLTEPSMAVLRQKIEALGYSIPAPTLIQSLQENPFSVLLGTFALLFGVYDGNIIFVILGLLLVGYTLLAGRIGRQ